MTKNAQQIINEILDDDSAEYEVINMAIEKMEAAATYLESVLDDLEVEGENNKKAVADVIAHLRNDIVTLEIVAKG